MTYTACHGCDECEYLTTFGCYERDYDCEYGCNDCNFGEEECKYESGDLGASIYAFNCLVNDGEIKYNPYIRYDRMETD